MATRTRPADCCAPRRVRPLTARQLDRAVTVAKALADPSRIELLRLLAGQPGPVCACDIVDHFDLSQPTISHHLKILREAGLVNATRRGLWRFYELDPQSGRALQELASHVTS